MPSSDGRRTPSVTDVAARAGVSVGTVSHVLNHPERVRPATREKVEAVIEELGFTPNANARTLVAGRSSTLGLVVADLGNTLFVEIARGAQREAYARGTTLLTADSDNDDDLQATHLEFLDRTRVAGVLLSPMADPGATVDRARRHGTPVVLVNYDTGRDDLCTVLVDNDRVGYLAAQHLLGLGFRRLAFVGANHVRLQPVRDRLAGARRAVAEAGGRASLLEVATGDVRPAGGRTAGREIASMPARRRPRAVIAVTDLLAMTVVQELLAAGLDVPGDVAVMGCDYDTRGWGGAVPLTSVHLTGQEVGREAVRLLLEEAAHEAGHVHRTVVVAPQLVVRASSAGDRAPAADGPVPDLPPPTPHLP
ncbi:LacI family DNA-binding transcriptional regulator [Kineococcus terrestris]|uniref:LacI family DNA-binding transcriptional regulator n=1 Tax=Kineococcus terrestris TaxID=2044856 RepID=UPI0034DB6AFF